MTHKQAIVDIRNVTFQYDGFSEQLKNVNFKLYNGECVVVTGPSGSGKTTLTRLVNGLIPNYYEGRLTGTVELHRNNVKDIAPWEIARSVGSVFQNSRSQFFASRVEEEIAFCSENRGIDSLRIRERVDLIAEEYGLTHLLGCEVHRLSGGEKQKVAFASARMADPELFVLDEPSANLDMAATKQLADRLARLKAAGKSLLIAEHRLYYLLPLADRVIYMRNGEIAAEWTPQEVLSFTEERLIEYGLRMPIVRPLRLGGESDKNGKRQRMALQRVAVSSGRWKRKVLEEVSFSMSAGEIIAVIGPNGAGKTSLAKTICGLVKERGGAIMLDGKKAKAGARLRKLWLVMQDSEYQLLSDSVMNELLLTHEREEGALRRAEKLLQELNLWELRDRHPASLSGGQKQRLTFAVGLMNRPHILILDEPTSGLDGSNMRRVAKLIRRIADTGVPVMIVTHDHELVFGVCDRAVYVHGNRLREEITVSSENADAIIRLMESTV